MIDKENFKLNIQLFGGEEGGEPGGEPTPNPAGNPEPTGDTGAGGNPPQPNGGEPTTPEPLTWENIKAEDYQELGDITPFITEAQEKGYTPDYIKSRLDDRKTYLTEQKAAFTPELNASMEAINNFIGAEKDTNRQSVYRAMAENATGAAILKEYIELKAGATGSVVGAGRATSTSTIDIQAWKEQYDDAIFSNNEEKKKQLEEQGLASGQEYFKVFFNKK